MSLELSFGLTLGSLELDVDVVCDGVTAVMGPNGAGKTTLLRACVGAITPERGRIALRGRALFDERGVNLPPELRNVAYVPQGLALFPHLSAFDNVLFACRTGTEASKRETARRLLAELELDRIAERMPAELSGGEQQKIALVRAMAAEPELLLLDEPLSALDPTARPRLRRFLTIWLAETDLPALVVTHDPTDAAEFADALLVLEDGKVSQYGALDEVSVRPATEFVAALTAGLIERRPRTLPPPSIVSEDE